ncbi:hypothetical protein ACJIZ3_015519 [Penstemon smallii]|uniref:C2 domain-containing protein n=1 Tax=Penstemon smallii TaxID=265156 RepID=A0ABD3RQP6_9LAMI
MSTSGIQGELLEITVVGCNNLKETRWVSNQNPYVCLEYASTKHRTNTAKKGGIKPTFQEKFVFNLIEGLREFSVVVWCSNTLSYDNLIGDGKVQLKKVLSEGYDDSSWSIQDDRRRTVGEVRLIMHYANFKKPVESHAPSPPPYAGVQAPLVPPCSAPPCHHHHHHQPAANHPNYQPSSAYPPPSAYPPQNPHCYPPGFYPPPPYPPP